VSQSHDLLRAVQNWEGDELPIEPSDRGEIKHRVNQLRGPHVFEYINGSLYLLYVGGGEKATGIT